MSERPITELVDWTKAAPAKDGSSVIEVTVGLRLRRSGQIDLFANADAIKAAADIPEFLEQVAQVLRQNIKGGKARTS